MGFYYCNEDDRIYSTDDIQREYFENPEIDHGDYETFDAYLSACMYWNNGALIPLADRVSALKKRLAEVSRFAIHTGALEWYADEIDNLTAQIAECESYKEV